MGGNISKAYPDVTVLADATVHGRPIEFFGVHPDKPSGSNQQAIQDALNLRGLVTLYTPGSYPIDSDTFTVPANTKVIIGPGVIFTIAGVPTTIYTLLLPPVDENSMRAAFARPPIKQFRELLAPTSATPWDDRAGAGMTVSVDSAVTFDGRPSLRLDIPAGSTGTYRVGTSSAAVNMPYNWDGKGLVMAMMTSNAAAVDGFTTIFLGDAGFTNYYSFAGQRSMANVPEAIWQANEWMLTRGTTNSVGGGAPTYTGLKRLRINFTVTSNASPTTIWIGFVGIVAPKRPTVIVSIDDGYRTGYDFVAPLARYYKIPVSFGIDRYYIQQGTATYFSEAMIRELHADTSDLFEFVTHGYNNNNVSVGDALYVQQQVETRDYLRSLGIAGDGPNHHPWVQSLQTNAAISLMRTAGFLSGRMGAATPKSVHDSHYFTRQDKRVFQQLAAISPTTGVTVADLQTAVTAAVTEGYGIAHVNMHQADAADAASPMTWSWDKWIDAFGWLAAQRDAGTIEIKCWGRAYADSVGAGAAYRK